MSGTCPTCGAPIGDNELRLVAEAAAESHLEGGDTFNGGEVCASCPRCGSEIVLQTEGYTETSRSAIVTKAVILR